MFKTHECTSISAMKHAQKQLHAVYSTFVGMIENDGKVIPNIELKITGPANKKQKGGLIRKKSMNIRDLVSRQNLEQKKLRK